MSESIDPPCSPNTTTLGSQNSSKKVQTDTSEGKVASSPPPPADNAQPSVSNESASSTVSSPIQIPSISTAITKPSYNFNFNVDQSSSDDDEERVQDGSHGEDEEELIDEMGLMPKYMAPRVVELRNLHDERKEVMERYLVERAELEARYHSIYYQPLYERRKNVIMGVFDEEIASKAAAGNAKTDGVEKQVQETTANAGRHFNKEIQEDVEEENVGSRERGIPQFWVCALSHMNEISQLITENDVDCLEHCIDIQCIDHEDGQGFTLKFFFDASTNAYFTNEVLTKRYDVPNLLLQDEPILKLVTGCAIDWTSDDKRLTFEKVQKRQRAKTGRSAGKMRTVTKSERRDSFFHFFNTPKMPDMDAMDEEQADAIEEAFDRDYDVAQAFRSYLIPNAVLWFTGEAIEGGLENFEQMAKDLDKEVEAGEEVDEDEGEH